jgi:hypothetical protein
VGKRKAAFCGNFSEPAERPGGLGVFMKEYEVIWEVFNSCPRNQMRDIFIEEVELEDPEAYVKAKFAGKEVSYEKTVLADGSEIYDIVTSGIKQRCTFSEI